MRRIETATHTAEALITMMMTMMMKMMAMTTEMIKTNVTDWRIEMLPLSRSAALQPMRKNPASETSDASFQTPIYAQCVDDFMVVNMSGLASDSAATSCCRCLTNLIIENFFPVAAPEAAAEAYASVSSPRIDDECFLKVHRDSPNAGN